MMNIYGFWPSARKYCYQNIPARLAGLCRTVRFRLPLGRRYHRLRDILTACSGGSFALLHFLIQQLACFCLNCYISSGIHLYYTQSQELQVIDVVMRTEATKDFEAVKL